MKCHSFTYFFSCITRHCLKLSPCDLILLYILWFQSLQFPVPPCDGSFPTPPRLLFYHLPLSHRGNQVSILSLKLRSSYLTLSGNSLCHLHSFKFKFYDSYLWLQILWLKFMSPISLTQTSSLRHLYFSLPTGQHALDSSWHLAINMSNNKHMTYSVLLFHVFPEMIHLPQSVAQLWNNSFRDSFLLVTPMLINWTPKRNSASQIFLYSLISFSFLF